jgi:hypothetical protein
MPSGQAPLQEACATPPRLVTETQIIVGTNLCLGTQEKQVVIQSCANEPNQWFQTVGEASLQERASYFLTSTLGSECITLDSFASPVLRVAPCRSGTGAIGKNRLWITASVEGGHTKVPGKTAIQSVANKKCLLRPLPKTPARLQMGRCTRERAQLAYRERIEPR